MNGTFILMVTEGKQHHSARLFIIAVATCAPLMVPLPTFAVDMSGEKECLGRTSTMDIVACISARTKTWDRRLNTAYAALQKVVDLGQRTPLQEAQRIWIQFRDANCRFYGAADGTIREVQEAQCLLAMTRDRTLEFEAAAKP